MAYGHRNYVCVDCGQPVNRTDPHLTRVGTFTLHPGCVARCTFCDETIERPPLGQAHTVVVFCGRPAHRSCKEQGTALAGRNETVNLELP
jgi:DNA-directed RNA polymerase subunit RPC12/RpoP